MGNGANVISGRPRYSADKYGDYCTAAIALFGEISRLPPGEAGAIMRDILAEK
jgi:hypothetical protein